MIQRNVANGVGEVHDGKTGCPPTNPATRDWKGNKHGSPDLPSRGTYTVEGLGNATADVVYSAWGINATEANNSVTAGGYDRFKRVQGRFLLPPGFFSGSCLKTLADAVNQSPTASYFFDNYGFDYQESKKVADAVRVVQTLVMAQQRVFTGSIFLDANYVGSSNHRPDAFCAFVDNVLAQGRPSTFLRRPTSTYKASATSSLGIASDAPRSGALPAVDLVRAMDIIIGLGNRAAQDLQDRFLGRLSTVGTVLERYSGRFGVPGRAAVPGGAAAITEIPAASMVQANIAAPRAGDEVLSIPTHVVFDPQQPGSPDIINTDDTGKTLHTALPPFAQQRFTPDGLATSQKTYQGKQLYFYHEGLAVPAENEAVKNAYTNIARVLFNFSRPFPNNAVTVDDTKSIFEAYKRRAVVLSLLTLVNDADPKPGADPKARANAIATRFNAIFSNILVPSGINPGTSESQANIENINLIALQGHVRSYFENYPKEAAETFGSGRSSGNKSVPRTASLVSQVIDQVAQQAESSKDAINEAIRAVATTRGGAATAAPRFDPNDYMRCDMRFSPEMFVAMYKHTAGGTLRTPLALPADPEDNDTIISMARYAAFAKVVEEGGVVPAALAPTHMSDRKLGSTNTGDLPAISNVRQLKRKGVFVGTSTIGINIPSSLEEGLRRSENYGVSQRSQLVPYGDQPPASDPTRGRFHLADAMAVDDAPVYFRPTDRRVTGVAGSLQCIDSSLDEHAASPGFQQLWDELDDLAQSDPALAAIGKVYLGTPTKWRNWEALARNNVIFPMTILLARPLIVFDTYSLYFLQAGAETLITRFGQPMSTWSNESQRQVYSLTLVFKSKTSCINERNIYHVPNAFISNLLRGFGCSFYTRESFKASCVPDVPGRDSLVAIAEPYEPYLRRTPQAVIALTGKFKFMDYS